MINTFDGVPMKMIEKFRSQAYQFDSRFLILVITYAWEFVSYEKKLVDRIGFCLKPEPY